MQGPEWKSFFPCSISAAEDRWPLSGGALGSPVFGGALGSLLGLEEGDFSVVCCASLEEELLWLLLVPRLSR